MKKAICTGWEFTPSWSSDFLEFSEPAEPVELPHNPQEVPLHYTDSGSYQMVCGYRRTLEVDGSLIGRRLFLQFDGAAHIAKLYVNGELAGEHRCGYTAFRADITKFVTPGTNQIALQLDTTENPAVPPFGFAVDYLTYGGLYREAWLIDKPINHITDVFVSTPTLDTVQVDVTASIRYAGEYQVTISTSAGEDIWQTTFKKGTVLSPHLPVRPWTPADPVRYLCRVRLLDGDRIQDTERVAFGFRTAEFREDGFYLNNEKFFMRGLNRHQCYPYIGYAATESLQREDARILKEELGCTAVRTSHYPQSQYFLDECDRLGLLVFTEIPGWQHIGDAAWREQALHNVEEMILQNRNHPSIVLWGVRINESVDSDGFYKQTNKLAHKLDPTRATSGVRYLEKSHLLEDVYAFNDFSHSGENAGCRPKRRVTPNRKKAFLISEHNGHMFPTKSFDSWEKRQEHAQRHMRVLNAAYASGEHAGCFGWCMFDYATHRDFGSGDRICYHGVMDPFRNPKPAAWAYASQAGGDIVLEPASPLDIGDYAAGKTGKVPVYSNAEEVALYKNGLFVTKLGRSEESALPHPPFLIDDTVGSLLETEENFPPKKAAIVRDCLNAAMDYGLSALPLRYKLKFVWCMLRWRMSMQTATELFGKYVSNWGSEATQWRLDALVDGKVVKSVTRAPSARLHMTVSPSALDLTIRQTYDMAAVRIRILDEWNSVASYAQLPVTLSAEGAIDLVGPDQITAEGGMCGCYVRTNGREGEGTLTVRAPGLEGHVLRFHVERCPVHYPQEPKFLSAEESPVLNDVFREPPEEPQEPEQPAEPDTTAITVQ